MSDSEQAQPSLAKTKVEPAKAKAPAADSVTVEITHGSHQGVEKVSVVGETVVVSAIEAKELVRLGVAKHA